MRCWVSSRAWRSGRRNRRRRLNTFEVLAIVGQAAADSGDLALEARNFPLLTGHDLAHHREVGSEPLEAPEFGTVVGASTCFDVGHNLLVEPMECFAVLGPIEFVPEGLSGGKLGRERCMMAVRISTGLGGFKVEVLDPRAGQLGEAYAGVDEQADDGQVPAFGERPPGDRTN